ncbi:hypothetical protein EDE15_2123 [Edaphobacter aggregans]|uniref:Uncharacterized protein n=1 Tax=Edaphobacter aggregans TaxID=570835 RepID=A0A3R9NTP5_9BACT|nr:hypothetical protein [Edaphobacter aggregans]RSL16602.1 hypothetical protein EDE15_2123 [Edaphobacter aggregans]
MQSTETATANSRPYLALGLTFLLLGVGYANPWPLVTSPPAGMWNGQLAFEVLNLYALVVFLGWAHFLYAWQGQWKASGRLTPLRRALYWGTVAAALILLAVLRKWWGVAVFSLVVWVYNIAHFIKAEILFAGARERSRFYSPVIAFAWFTLVLFQAGPMGKLAVAVGGSVLLAVALLVAGDWRVLAEGQVRLPVLTLFLLGETLVWTAYGQYMSPAFRVGIYVFHIAAASFFHYLSSYFFASGRSRLTQPWVIAVVNVVFLCAGYAVAHTGWLRWASVWLAPEWFTLWVALHLVGSDLLPWWRRSVARSTAQTQLIRERI